MADLDLDALVAAAFALALGFDVAAAALGFEPGGEEGGVIEDALEFADDLGGGNGGGFVNGEEPFDDFRHGVGRGGPWKVEDCRMTVAMIFFRNELCCLIVLFYGTSS